MLIKRLKKYCTNYFGSKHLVFIIQMLYLIVADPMKAIENNKFKLINKIKAVSDLLTQ